MHVPIIEGDSQEMKYWAGTLTSDIPVFVTILLIRSIFPVYSQYSD